MASYEEIKQRLLEEDVTTPGESSATKPSPARPRSTSSGTSQILLGGLAIAMVFGILFGVPAYVDSRQPEKSKLTNRVDAARWALSFFDRKSNKKRRRTTRGPLDAAFK